MDGEEVSSRADQQRISQSIAIAIVRGGHLSIAIAIAIVLGGPQQQSIAIAIVPKRGNSNSFSIAIVHFMPVSLALEAHQWPLIVMLPPLQLFCLLCPLQKLRNNIFQTRKKSIEMELLINSNSNSWEILLSIATVPKMSIAIVISILLISSG